LAAGALGSFSAGLLIADVLYRLKGAERLTPDLSVVSLVLASVALLLALRGWRRTAHRTDEGG